MNGPNRGGMALAAVTLVAFLMAFVTALGFPTSAGYFPLGVTAAGIAASGAYLVIELMKARAVGQTDAGVDTAVPSTPEAPDAAGEGEWRAAFGWILWASAYVVLLWLLGMIVATVIFLIGSLRLFGKAPWWGYIVAVGMVGLLWYVSEIFALEWPQGMLQLF